MRKICSKYHSSGKLIIPDYVYDRHTSIGKKKGRGMKHFYLEGSVVKNADPVFSNDRLRELYGRMKGVKPENKLVKASVPKCPKFKLNYDDLEKDLPFVSFSEFKNIRLTNSKTCGGKVMCIYANYNGEEIVLKEGRPS